MRGPAAALVILVLVLASAPAAAAPFPQTRHAARAFVHETLDEADATAAGALLQAQALVAQLRHNVPSALIHNGAIETRAAMAQPVVKDHVDFLSTAWVAAKSDPWIGAFWIEANGAATSPNVYEFDDQGALLFLDQGATPLPASVDITYHFLGIDGVHVAKHIGVSQVLDFMPISDHADFGAGVASARGASPEALLVTPWNVIARNATLQLTLHAGDGILASYTIESCSDPNANAMEPGCRQLYVLEFPGTVTSVTLSHDGILDKELTRAQLLAGYQFSA